MRKNYLKYTSVPSVSHPFPDDGTKSEKCPSDRTKDERDGHTHQGLPDSKNKEIDKKVPEDCVHPEVALEVVEEESEQVVGEGEGGDKD